ncbi:hypothetical protein [Pseudomonas luteola]|nr:hypothetical protein [Pseudomonas luteola]
MSVIRMILQRHVEHFHALIFLLGYIDWHLADGSMLLARIAGSISALGFAYIIAHSMRHNAKTPVALAAVAALALGFNGWGIWTVSFQAVVSTFWFIYTLNLYFVCKDATSTGRRGEFFGPTLLTGAVAIFAHGSGFMSILFVPLIYALFRRFTRAVISFVFLAGLFYFGVQMNSVWLAGLPAPDGLNAGLILRAVFLDTFNLTSASLAFIGSAFTDSPMVAVALGGVAVIWAALAAVMNLRRFGMDRYNVFAIAILLSGLLSAALGAGLRYVINVYVSHYEFDLTNFMASRYYMAAVAVWLGALMLTVRLANEKTTLGVSLVLWATALVTGYVQGVPQAYDLKATEDMAEASFQSGYRSAELMGWMFPDPHGAWVLVNTLEKNRKSMFGEEYKIRARLHELEITERTPIKAFLPDGTQVTACKLSGPTKDKRHTVVIRDLQGRDVGIGRYSSTHSNMSPEKLDVDFYLNRSPDLNVAMNGNKEAAIGHWQTFGRSELLRPARSKKPGWLAFSSTCDARAYQ